MSIDVNAIEQTVEVTAVGDEVNVNIIDQPVLVSVTDQIIEVEASGAAGPQGPAGAGVAAGGTTGQVLSKLSNTNYDTVWVNAGAGTVYSVNASGSTGISVTGGPITGAGTLTITNTAPDQIVGLTGAGTAVITGTYPNFTITANDQYSGTVTSVNLTAGTGISVSGGPITASGSINVVNTSPDQVVSLTGGGTTTITGTYPNFTISSADSTIGTVTSVNMTVPTGLTISGNPITSAGTLALALASGYSIPTTASQATWDAAYNDKINSASVTGTATKTLTLTQQDGGTITANWSDIDTGLTSVGLSMPSAFSVANSPLTSNGTLAVTGAGLASQYIRGDGALANFPTTGGGGSSVSYYLNGSVSQGTFGGDTYYEMSKTPIIGAGTNFTRTNAQGNGYIASFITDAGDPALLNIPGGNWNVEFYFQASSGGGSPSFYAELYKVSSANVFTLIASGSTNPEGITNGTAVDQYFTSIPVPQTALLATDRIAIRIFVTPSGRTITLHTEDNNLCEVLTTFSTGLNALNGLTAQVQYFATGTSGTDFAISSATDTHTFNLPIASGTNTGKLSNTDWTSFNAKQNTITLTTTGSSGASTFVSNTLNVPTYTLTGLGGVPSTRSITINGTAFDLSADRTFNVGTVTSVAATAGTGITISGSPITTSGTLTITNSAPDQVVALTASTGISVSGTYPNFTITNTSPSSGGTVTSVGLSSATSGVTIGSTPITTSGTITLAIATASGSQNGLLSSTDWTTFNGKQNAITLTTTGTSGAATLVGATLNIPQYADQFVGTVTSVAALTIGTTGTDLSSTVANGTTTPVITLQVPTASAANRGALSSADWSTFNGKQAALSGTGFVKISGTTISYDNSTYALDSSVVHNTGTETVAGAKTFTSQMTVSTGPASIVIKPDNSSNGGILWRNSVNGGHWSITSDPSSTGAQGVWDFRNDNLSQSCFSIAPTTNIVTFSSNIIASSLIKSGGTSSQYLMADGSTSTLTNPVTGTGTTNYLPKWTSGSAIGNSTIQDNTSSIVYTFSTNPVINVTDGTRSSFFGTATSAGAYVNASQVGDAFIRANNGIVLSGSNGTGAELRLTSGGNLLVNSTTDNGNRLQVTGDGSFTGQVNSAFFYTTATSSPSGQEGLRIANNNGYIGFFNGGNSTRSAYIQGNTTDLTINTSLATPILFGTSNVEKMRLDASGNLGLGVTPSAWRTTNPAFQIGQSGALYSYSNANIISLTANSFITQATSDERYIANGFATLYQMNVNGEHRWLNAPSGTAGNVISFTQAMTLTANGRLLLGTTTESGDFKLQVNGNEYIKLTQGAVQTWSNSGNSSVNIRTNTGYNSILAFTEESISDRWSIGTKSADSNLYFSTGDALSAIKFTLSSTGAATFSSSVTATQFVANGNSAGGFEGLRIVNASTGAAQIALNNSAQSWLVNTRTDNHFSIFNATASTTPFFINTNGNVLIGTTTDIGQRLQVSGGYIAQVDGGVRTFLGYDGTGSLIGTTTNHYLRFITNDTERMRITSGGKINFSSLPTSATGLSAGDIWNDGGTLKIV